MRQTDRRKKPLLQLLRHAAGRKDRLQKCGNAFEGSFCPFCGEKEAEIAATAVAAAPRAAAKGSADKALSVVQTSLVFTGIVLLFVFSFFIGITGSVVSSDATLKSTDSTFYFLIGTWKDVSAVLEELRLANNGNLFSRRRFQYTRLRF